MKLVYKFTYEEKQSDKLYELCKTSKNLYNQALYTIKQSLKNNNKFLFYGDINNIMQHTVNLDGNVNYKLLKAQVSQQCLRILDKNIKSYVKSIKDWSKHKEKYHGKPKLPKYKNDTNLIVYTNQCCTIKNGYINLSKDLKIRIPQYDKYKDKIDVFKQIRIIPNGNYFIIEIVYEINDMNNGYTLDKCKYASIDLGVDNLATVIFDNINTIIYNGKVIKSINQYANKQIAKYKSELENKNKRKSSKRIKKIWLKRNNRINDSFHKISKDIVNRLVENGIGKIVVGYNKGWKDSIRIGKRNNQTFVNIPFDSLINKLKYKCEIYGIEVIINEESYTSKCDGLAYEIICKHDEYLGKRVRRGMYQSSCGKLINADVNGSLNIMRKVICDSEVTRIIDSGWLFQPLKLNI